MTVDRALRLLGFGTACVEPVAVDGDGAMLPDALAERLADGSGPVVVCAQAGNVNTGAVDPLDAVCDVVDRPAPGCTWTAPSASGRTPVRGTRPLLRGCERADSWATDGHKWLNVPYDCGIAVVADRDGPPRRHVVQASYLAQGGPVREPMDWTPEFSRRARSLRCTRRCARSGAAAWPSWWTGSVPAPIASPSASRTRRAWRCSRTG